MSLRRISHIIICELVLNCLTTFRAIFCNWPALKEPLLLSRKHVDICISIILVTRNNRVDVVWCAERWSGRASASHLNRSALILKFILSILHEEL